MLWKDFSKKVWATPPVGQKNLLIVQISFNVLQESHFTILRVEHSATWSSLPVKGWNLLVGLGRRLSYWKPLLFVQGTSNYNLNSDVVTVT